MKYLLPLLILSITTFAQDKAEKRLLRKADKIHARAYTVDTHADAPINMLEMEGFDVGQKHNYAEDGTQIDFPRMKEGGMDAMFFAVYLGQGKRTPEANVEAKEKALKIFTKIHEAVKNNADKVSLVTTAKEGFAAHKQGKLGVFIGMENGWPVGTDLNNLKIYYDLGLRYITLAHSFNNDLSDSSGDPNGAEHGGLSKLGEACVAEMNRLGIMVDVSHLSDSAFYDVMRVSKVPVIASHSSCRALCDVKRNMTDDMIKLLASKGGVIHINFVADFLKKPSAEVAVSIKTIRMQVQKADATPEDKKRLNAELRQVKYKYPEDMPTVKDVVNHIDHVVKLVGVDHVGIGMDMDGGSDVIGIEDVSKIKNVTIELLRRGYSVKDIRKIWGENTMRVLAESEKFAKK
ncbi:peptidase M19 renal dipeptidase [Emticicia oligotrophica DSM 17448]|uniref:Peptidase M19 renal dipeptidase n=1 Tax=Emticicia oligotrophica (strain DSM 17448 / CIP 109782 / MTCC 6937 / GPTSA100-15) TaxID=929562 RepID=A0ABM5MYX5_EMTOG|nr:dipeptidase [Emticicia oligotrophica]AFK02369.1 peptidase M19 renal dipeptidase [Emticicia oligotrophica DSM 17448]